MDDDDAQHDGVAVGGLIENPHLVISVLPTMLKRNPNGALAVLHECARDEPSGKSIAVLLTYEAQRGTDEQLHAFINGRALPSYNCALHFACYRGLPRNVEVLLEAGADTSVLDCRGSDPYWYVVQGTKNAVAVGSRKDFLEIALLFKARGHDLTHTTRGGLRLPTLPAACEFGHTRLVQLLLKSGADVHERSYHPMVSDTEALRAGCFSGGETALHQACHSGDASIVKMILKAGGDTRARTVGNRSALPIEFWNMNVRVADVIMRWEEDHNIDTADFEKFEDGCISSSEVCLLHITEAVKRYRQTGALNGGSIPISKERIICTTDRGPERKRELEEDKDRMWSKHQETLTHLADMDHKRNICSNPGCPNKNAFAKSGGRFDMKKCSRCKRAFYCDKACQTVHWKVGGHRQGCNNLD